MEFENLTDEQQAKAAACKSPEELLALAREEGMELSDEDLAKISGGGGSKRSCPSCGSEHIVWDDFLSMFICRDCGYEYT